MPVAFVLQERSDVGCVHISRSDVVMFGDFRHQQFVLVVVVVDFLGLVLNDGLHARLYRIPVMFAQIVFDFPNSHQQISSSNEQPCIADVVRNEQPVVHVVQRLVDTTYTRRVPQISVRAQNLACAFDQGFCDQNAFLAIFTVFHIILPRG